MENQGGRRGRKGGFDNLDKEGKISGKISIISIKPEPSGGRWSQKSPFFLGRLGTSPQQRETPHPAPNTAVNTRLYHTWVQMWFPEHHHNGKQRRTQGEDGEYEQKDSASEQSSPHLNKVRPSFWKGSELEGVFCLFCVLCNLDTRRQYTQRKGLANCHLVTFSHKLNQPIAGPAPNGNGSMRLPKFVTSDEFGFHRAGLVGLPTRQVALFRQPVARQDHPANNTLNSQPAE